MASKEFNVLIVDDNDLCLEILIEHMGNLGYSVDTARDGNLAVELFESTPKEYQLIILDRMMPHMDGLELIAIIKSNPLLKNTPIIMQTGMAEKDNITEALKAGADICLTKPFTKQELIDAVNKLK